MICQLGIFDDDNDATARWSDPESSHETNRSIGRDAEMARLLIAIASSFDEPFDDWDLTLTAEDRGRRIQRNVVARTRGLMEKDGVFRRVGEFHRDHPGCRSGRKYVHFVLNGQVRP